MSPENQFREDVCRLSASLFERGLRQGSSGNVLLRLADGGLLVIPTGASLGRLDPARLARLDADGRFVSGDRPTKEVPLHEAFYATRRKAGAAVHLHSAHAVAWSTLPEVDPEDALPPSPRMRCCCWGVSGSCRSSFRAILRPAMRSGDWPASFDPSRTLWRGILYPESRH